MSGKVPPSSRAGRTTRKAILSQYERAADLFERFTGHDAQPLAKVRVPATPAVLAVIGTLDGVLYTTTRDGVEEKYIHEFASKDKPLLCVSPNGERLFLIEGNYVFTERGIVDKSDKKNLPALLTSNAR